MILFHMVSSGVSHSLCLGGRLPSLSHLPFNDGYQPETDPSLGAPSFPSTSSPQVPTDKTAYTLLCSCWFASGHTLMLMHLCQTLITHRPNHIPWPNSKLRLWTKKWLLDRRVARSHCKKAWRLRGEVFLDITLSNVVVPFAKKYFYSTYMQNMLIPRTSKSLTYHRIGLNLEVQGVI